MLDDTFLPRTTCSIFDKIAGAVVGSVLGGIGGGGEPSYGDRIEDRNSREDTFIQRRVKDAKVAGIHPLAALGAQYSYTPVRTSRGSTPSDVIASGVNAIGEATAEQSRNQRADRALNLEQRAVQSQIGMNEAQRELIRAQTLSIHDEIRNRAQNRANRMNTDPDGGDDPPVQMYIDVVDDDGNVIRYPNPDLAMGIDELPVHQAYAGAATTRGEDRGSPVFSFRQPENPTDGQLWRNALGRVYRWNGSRWIQVTLHRGNWRPTRREDRSN